MRGGGGSGEALRYGAVRECAGVQQRPGDVIEAAKVVLKPGGSLIVLVPQSETLFGSIDRSLGHKQRFNREGLAALLEAHGFTVREFRDLNKIGRPAWWLFGHYCCARRSTR